MSRMMRNALYISLMSIILLTACGGGGDDTPAPDNATPDAQNQQPPAEEVFSGDQESVETPQVASTYYNELGTIIPQDQVTPFVPQAPQTGGIDGFSAPPVGVLGAASTPDPNQPRVSGFDYLFYEQSGGINAETLRVEVYSDGRVILNGSPTTNANPSDISAIAALMDQIDFFGMQGTFLGPAATDDTYYYRMGASQSDGTSRLIQARDGYMPPEIIRLFALIRGLVENNPSAGS